MTELANMRSYNKTFLILVLLFAALTQAHAQKLSFSNHRERKIPEYALLRIGPFYSNLTFIQEAGYRYTSAEGVGTDFLFDNRRGRIREDGAEFPLISTLSFRNYLLLTRNVDIDFSGKIVSENYPLGTQDDAVYVDLIEEGVEGIISSQIEISPFMKLLLSDSVRYRTDYVDLRGFIDDQGGQEFEHLQNVISADLDWLMAPEQNMFLSIKRTDVISYSDTFSDQERVEWSETLGYEQKVNFFATAGISAGASQALYSETNRSDVSMYNVMLFSSIRATERTMMRASVGYSDSSLESDIPAASADGEREDAFEDVSSVIIGGLTFKTELSKKSVQSYGYSRSQVGGFTTALEARNELYYKFGWIGDFTSVNLESSYTQGETSRSGYGDYTDWRSAVNLSRELLSFLTLNLDADYSIRNNSQEGQVDLVSEADEIELTDDYDTWSAKIGTDFGVMKDLVFRTSFKHIERISDAEELDYERDIFEAKFVYTHKF